MVDIIKQLIKEFNLKPFQAENTVRLIEEGNTIPFIARYRKEMTGELNDQVLREFHERFSYLKNLEERKEDVKRLIDEQGKLTKEIGEALENASTLQKVEDIYRPYKPKRRTRASIAKEKGLEPLANVILSQEIKQGSIEELAVTYINTEKGVNTTEDALNGSMDIIAEVISDNAEFREALRDLFFKHGTIVTSAVVKEDSVYNMYYDYKEPVSRIAKHRILAINRGEKEHILQVIINVPDELLLQYLKAKVLKKNGNIVSEYVEKAIEDSYERLIVPSIENEVRNLLTEKAEEQAVKVFSENLRNLLLQPPVKGRIVLGLDPAYRTGCKLAVVDDTGKVLDKAVIYPTPPQNKIEESKKIMKEFIEKYKVDIVSIGNGTASKESELFTAELLKEIDREVYYMIVNEAGASVYSASKLAAEEFPDFDVSMRSAVSIARRLQDPLAELVKIDPKSIGVGQYQHDVNRKKLDKSLGDVVEYAVNSVGVDLNTASASLLSYVSGINSGIAKNIIEYREKNGRFLRRDELKKVKKLGEKAFEQCAGFLRISDSANVLDNTSVHPESYEAVEKLLEATGYSLDDIKKRNLVSLKQKIEKVGIEKVAVQIDVGVPTLKDMIEELQKPGRDPRDELPAPILRSDVMDIEDLKPDMVLTGTVRNVSDFGAFVDIGVHQDGLVHISEMSDKFVRHPMDITAVGDIVTVRVIDVDAARKRISLSMKETFNTSSQ
jgi:protein Tex